MLLGLGHCHALQLGKWLFLRVLGALLGGAAGEDTSGYVGGSMAMLCTEFVPMRGVGGDPRSIPWADPDLMLSWALPVPVAVQPVRRAFEAQLGPPCHSGL